MKITREQFNELKTLPIFKSKVVSDSMAPLIKVGDDIVVDVGAKSLGRFDIIVIYLDEKLVCHYLWNINKIVQPVLLQTRNMSGKMDFPVPIENYLGKVISHKLSLWQKLRFLF